MKCKAIFFFFLMISSQLMQSQDLKPEYQKFISSFISEVKNNNKNAVAARITFPLKREYPIPKVKNKTDFIKRYNEIFDKTLISKITKSNPAKDWSEMGWRGIMLNQGDLWMDTNGKIIAINYQSEAEKKQKSTLIAAQK
ncbi:hypothetical protein [Flavobacterium ustbae]|uniref:hypothetical protein n=1 Tax=Flavobacterium ustbae TaxID=2488790 RepID=UPI001F21E716|nr:hypothetical protein [Flavobacterium ustbae]